MYLPQAFALTRPDELARLLHAQPFGALVSHGPDGLTADHLPFEFDPTAGPHGTLWAHVARANPLWQRGSGAQVLVLFSGAQGYVSPSWYPSKAQTQRQVPTQYCSSRQESRPMDSSTTIAVTGAERLLAWACLADRREAGVCSQWVCGLARCDREGRTACFDA